MGLRCLRGPPGSDHRRSLFVLDAVDHRRTIIEAMDINDAAIAIHINKREFEMVEPDLVRIGTRVVNRVLELDVGDIVESDAHVVAVHALIIPHIVDIATYSSIYLQP